MPALRGIRARYRQCEDADGGDEAQPAEPVAEADVWRYVGAEIAGGFEFAADVGRKARHDAAVGIDGDGETVVRIAQHPASTFDRTDARHHQMLRGGGAAAEPAVVRDVD